MKKLFYSSFFFLTLALCSCNDSISDIRENRSKFLNKSSEDNLNKNQKYTIKGKVREIKNLLIDEIYIEENKK